MDARHSTDDQRSPTVGTPKSPADNTRRVTLGVGPVTRPMPLVQRRPPNDASASASASATASASRAPEADSDNPFDRPTLPSVIHVPPEARRPEQRTQRVPNEIHPRPEASHERARVPPRRASNAPRPRPLLRSARFWALTAASFVAGALVTRAMFALFGPSPASTPAAITAPIRPAPPR